MKNFLQQKNNKFRLNGKGQWVSEGRMDRRLSEVLKNGDSIAIEGTGLVWRQETMGHLIEVA